MKFIIVVLSILFLALQYRLWYSPEGYREVQSLKQAIERQRTENQGLRERNLALDADIQDLRHGDQAKEARAREELGLIKEGEWFYQVVD